FVLVDYKGGSAFAECADLPHTVGLVTDLDTHLVERALVSLGAELRRREHLLAGFVPAVYQYRAPERNDDGTRQRNWDPDRSERWLGYLAHSLTQGASERRDLAWWRLGHTLRVPSRIVYVTLVCALCMAVATWLVQLLALPSGALGPMRVETVFLQGALVGLLTGVA
ncbi:hypothetical protein, partial [Nocardioides marinquilinus]|uniref:hypothetical protein n=1 Tax=Nocardioides marinquilinus TaxID=1210400 RepID=UPI0031E76385